MVTKSFIFYFSSSQPSHLLVTRLLFIFLLLDCPPPPSPFLVNSVFALDNVIVVETFF
jgi:cellulose biosynthesis protein BcsQ